MTAPARAVDEGDDLADRRSRVLVLTAKGREVRAEVVRAALANTPLVTLTADDLEKLRTLLGRALGESA